MKPTYLSIENINSFTTKQEIDFTLVAADRLFCITGATGSGKTTVLDCIVIALYAPRNHNRGTLKEYINLNATKGEIVFRFDFENEAYEIKRVLNRSGSTGGYIKKVSSGEILADQTEKINAKVEQMLKISAEDFTRVVVLEQGQYAKFMSSKPSERNEAVAKLFNLTRFERLKEIFKNMAKSLEDKSKDAAAKLEQLKDVTATLIADKTTEINALKKQLKKDELLLSELGIKRDAAAAVAAAFAIKQNASAKFNQATSALGSLKTQEQVLNSRKQQFEAAEQALKTLKTAEGEARITLTKIDECEGDLKLRAAAQIKREKLLAEYKKIELELSKITSKTDAFGVDLEQRLLTITKQLKAATISDAAGVVASGLNKGDSCPVCGAVFSAAVSSGSAADITMLEKTQQQLTLNQQEKNKLDILAAQQSANLGFIKADGLRIKDDIDAIDSRIKTRLISGDLAALKLQANNAIVQYEDAEKLVTLDGKRLNEELTVYAAETARLTAVAQESMQLLKKYEHIVEDTNADSINEQYAKANLDIRQAISSIATLEASVLQLKQRLEQKRTLEQQRTEINLRLDKATIMRKLFEGNKFLEYAAQEFILRFTLDASDILSTLTSGKYTLQYDTDEKDFFVVDFLAANERRKVKTLSGGETFLASMSVAIAISREIACDKNYEFFFLDEGFGTLHEKAIDTVLFALRKLSEHTIVGVVSHRSELTNGIASKLVVHSADSDCGSRVQFVCG